MSFGLIFLRTRNSHNCVHKDFCPDFFETSKCYFLFIFIERSYVELELELRFLVCIFHVFILFQEFMASQFYYSLRSIILFTNIDVFNIF
jgi:hypothetical protein